VKIYLYINAALYLLFALWCTVAPRSTAASLGYKGLSPGGRSEYLVIYGGLQLGLAAMFCLCARNPAFHDLGLRIAVALYAFIVLYRLATLILYWPVSTVTAMTGMLEAALLIAALVIWKVR
jgi:hypothetical protein